MAHVQVFGRFLLEWGYQVLRGRRWPDDQAFLSSAYRTFLEREPDDDGRQYYLEALRRKSLSRWGVLRSITQSSEYKQRYGLAVSYLDAQHQARMMLVRRCLPAAQVIVDLGGAASGRPEGALLAMGYPHHPREIWIVDLPPLQRLGGGGRAEPGERLSTADGIQVSYFYGSMTDLSPFADESADLVWSGESIEHVTESEADTVCHEVYRVLKPGGHFCLDTPNASLTRLQSPDALIHPEHKKEYQVHELCEKLARWGFQVEETQGICPIPHSAGSGVFDYEELVRNVGLSDDPEISYMFYVRAVKPSGNASC
jgi:SAM-dependent methyltransferase